MAAIKQTLDINFLRISNRKSRISKVLFEEFDTDRESCGSSSSEDLENCSPKSAVEVFGRRRVHSQIARIRLEDLHIGEDIGECLIARFSGTGDHELVDDVMFSRSASPLSGRVSKKLNA